MGKKVKHLRDELIKTFLLYALIPTFLVMALSGALAVWYWNSNVVERNHRCLDIAAHSVESLLTASQVKVLSVADEFNVDRLRIDSEYKVELYQKLYEVKNSIATASEFYVFDNNRQMMLGSHKLDSEHFFATQSVSWGLLKRLQMTPDMPAYEFTSPIDNFSQTMDIIVGKAIVNEGKIDGYIIFLISGSTILSDIANPYVDIVVKNDFDYTPICTNNIFCDDMYKMKDIYRSANGYTNLATMQFYAAQRTIMNGKLTIYSFTSLSGMIDKLTFVGFVLVMILGVICLLVVMGIRQQAAAKTRMIDRLVEGFTAVEDGNLTHRIVIDTDNELKLIGDSYNHMLDSLQQLIKNNEEKARETVISEIKQLESQFNPHFLFNTLENIRYMIKLNPDSAARMILALSQLLRYSINNSSGYVTLKEDLRYLNSYLDIQKLRFGIKLNYAIEVDDKLYDCVVPKLFLQPVVENAVKYGFKNQESLFIDISLQYIGNQMIIKVYDNGCGIGDMELYRLNNSLKEERNLTNHSGLYNVNRRIKLICGDAYGLELVKNESAGITVYMVLPYQVNEVG